MERAAEVQSRIVVVEDHPATAYGLEHLFRLHLLDARIARDGASALVAIREHRPHIVFSDLDLPDISGIELASRVRREFGSSPILIAVTGRGDTETVFAAMSAGFNAHLTKPADPLALLRLARDAVLTADPS